MHFIGVDLAWGQTAKTGLAVVDDAGALLDIATRRTDQEIADWLAPLIDGPCLVAIDAPIIVNNPTGNRACERLINRYFGRYDAACHSSNTGNIHFADGTRALRLADRFGLTVDPAATTDRRAIEVYPHPATVALFGLPRILQYKNRKGRDFDHLRTELLQLLSHLEGLKDASPRLRLSVSPAWRQVRQAVERATRKSELGAVEDSIDAVVCAYIAAYSVTNPAAVRVMGTAADGYILTPVTEEIGLRFDTDQAATPVVTHEAGVVVAFSKWLTDQGWLVTTEVDHLDIHAVRGDERLYVEAKGRTSSPGLDVDTMFGQLLRRMTDETARYGVVVPDGRPLTAVLRVPEHIRRRLRIEVYAVSDDGAVTQADSGRRV